MHIDQLAPPWSEHSSVEERRKVRLIIYAISVAGLATVAVAVMTWVLGYQQTSFWLLGTLLFYVALVYGALWFTQSTRVSAHLFMVLVAAIISYDFGPDSGYGILAGIALPVGAAALLGAKWGIIWMLVAIAWEVYLGPIVIRPEDFTPALGFASAVMTIVIGTAAIIVESTRANAMQEAESQRERLQDHSERLWHFAERTFPATAEVNNGRLTHVGHGFDDLLGYPPGEINISNIADYVHPDDVVLLFKELPQRADSGLRREIRFRHNDGVWHWHEMYGIPQVQEASEQEETSGRRWIFAVRSIHDEIQSRERLQQAQRLQSVGVLAAGLAHDFNNLLTVILGRATLLPDSEERQHILAAADQAASLTAAVRAFGRDSWATAETIKPSEIVQSIAPMFASLLGEEVQFEVYVEPSELCVVLGEGQLEQVLLNLVTNAKEAITGPGRVAISIEEQTLGSTNPFDLAAGDYIKISVEDSGCGMSPETIQHAYEPFYSTKPVKSGSGLGLASTYGIITRVGGSVDLVSELGMGTTVTMYIPASTDALQTESSLSSQYKFELFKDKSCLLVEDQTSVRDVLSVTLEKMGFAVASVQDAERALAYLTKTTPDIVVSDIVMPGMHGTELKTRLRKEFPDLPVLLMSGYDQGHSDPVQFEDGKTRFLAKPIRETELHRTLSELINPDNAAQTNGALSHHGG